MTTDGSSGPGLSRSFTALGGDLTEAVAWLVGHATLFTLSLGLWLGAGTAASTLAPEIAGSADPATLATAAEFARHAWVVLVVAAPAVAVATVLADPAEGPLGGRPATVFLPLVPALAVLVGAALVAAPSVWTGPALALAVAVLVRRTVHWYAQHVRVGRFGRVGRTLFATTALLPLSAALVRIEVPLVAGYTGVEAPATAWVEAWLVARGLPAQVDVGAAVLPVDVAVLLTAAATVPAAYLLGQWLVGLPTALDGSAPGRPPGDGDAQASSAIVWSGTTVALAAGVTKRRRGATAVSLPDDRSQWKYDDAEAERAHRQAQQRDPSEAVEIGEVVPLVLEDVDHGSDPPTVMGSRNALKVFVSDVPDDLSVRDTICVKVTDYGGKRTSADAVFLSRGRCSDADRER